MPDDGASGGQGDSAGQARGERSVFPGSRFFRRLFIYFLGNFVLAFGVALAAKSNLGLTPINSIAYVVSRILSVDHGLMTAVVYCGYVLVQLVILRKEFRPLSFLQIGVAVLFGFFVSLCNRILSFLVPEAYWFRILLMLASVIMIALGLFLYLRAELLPQPGDGLLLTIQKKTGWKLHNTKMFLDCTVTASAAAVSLIAARRIIGIREGTLIAMFGIGKVMGFFSGRLGPKIDAFFRL